jgi:hypothetical protein
MLPQTRRLRLLWARATKDQNETTFAREMMASEPKV